jgi:hypothetical protein
LVIFPQHFSPLKSPGTRKASPLASFFSFITSHTFLAKEIGLELDPQPIKTNETNECNVQKCAVTS